MTNVILGTFHKLGDAIGDVRNDMSEGFILDACLRVGKTLQSLLAGEAITSCIDEMEKMKLWVSSLPAGDKRQKSMVNTIQFGDAMIAGSISVRLSN